MTTQALLDAVLRQPERVELRLVLADALMEQADPRGEFIAAQCRGDESRAEALLTQHATSWRAGLFVDECVFLHGFPEDVFLAGTRVTALWPELVRVAPVQRAQLAGLTVATLRTLLALPGVERLRSLDLSRGALGDEGAELLAACNRLKNLQQLRLCACGIGAAGARVLANSAQLPSLERLDLSANPLQAAGVHELATGTGLATMRQLRAFRVGAPTTALEQRFGPPCAPGPGLLCVELPAGVKTTGLALGQVTPLEVNRELVAGIDPAVDLHVPSILGGRRNSSYRVDENGRAWLWHMGHSLALYVNGQPWMGRDHALEHGDLVEMPYRGESWGAQRPGGPVTQRDLELRRGLGLVYIGPPTRPAPPAPAPR